MVLALPGSKGLFSLLQPGFRYKEKNRIKITTHIEAQLRDMEHLARELGTRPTRLAEIVPDMPAALGACDAAGMGMGGVWFPATTNGTFPTTLWWWAPFPRDIQDQLVSDKKNHRHHNQLRPRVGRRTSPPGRPRTIARLPRAYDRRPLRQHPSRSLATKRIHHHNRTRGLPAAT